MSETTTDTSNTSKDYSQFLYGRLPIFTSIDGFSPDNPLEIISEVNEALSIHCQNLLAMEYLYWYRRGITPIYAKTKTVRPEINHKVSVNIAEQIVDFKNGYFLAQPAFYTSRNDDANVAKEVKNLNEYLYRSGKQTADNDLVDWFHTVGKADLFIRSVDNPDVPYEAHALDPRSAFVVRSFRAGNPVVYGVNIAIRGEVLYLDVWDRYFVYRLLGTVTGKLTTPDCNYVCTATDVISVEPNPLGAVPIIEYKYNSVGMSAFESVIPLLNLLNDITSGRIDSIDQFVQSLLIFYNCELGEDDNGKPITTRMVREAGALFLKTTSENRADVKEISSTLDQAQTQTFVDHIYHQILAICGMPDTTKGGSSTSDTGLSVELRDGWMNCEMRARNCEDLFKKSNKEFDKIMLNILKAKNLTSISLNDFELNFTRNEVRGAQSKAQALNTLLSSGLNPIIALAKSGISADPVSDFESSKDYMRMRWGDPSAPIEQPKTEILEQDNNTGANQ